MPEAVSNIGVAAHMWAATPGPGALALAIQAGNCMVTCLVAPPVPRIDAQKLKSDFALHPEINDSMLRTAASPGFLVSITCRKKYGRCY